MLPATIRPMLATLAEPFDSPEYVYEIKWDGYRCLAFLDSQTRLQSRNEKEITFLFPELVSLHDLAVNMGCIVDGEVIALRNGKPSFPELQKRAQLRKEELIRIAVQKVPVVYIAFDILYVDYEPVISLPWHERRRLLEKTLNPSDLLIISEYVAEKGTAYFESITELKLEGVVAKDKNSPYLPGKRVKSWRKFKRKLTGNFIVCGMTINPTTRGELSSLILGSLVDGTLQYFGMVGTGFSARELIQIEQELRKISMPHSPFPGHPLKLKNAIWTRPIIVCEVEYLELTDEGSLRHPSFQRFRPDLKPSDCEYIHPTTI